MKKIISLALIAAAVFAAANANAISESYRRQLQREQQTQMQESHAANSNFSGLRQYKGGEYGKYMIEADKNCHIKTINGFPPKSAKRMDASMTVYQSRIETVFTAFTTASGCKYQYSYNGEVGDLTAQ